MSTDIAMAIAGGLLIGTSAVLLLLLLGRIAGISGIVWGALANRPLEYWRWLFVAGLLGGGVLAHAAGVPLPEASRLPTSMAILGGLLVGIGTRIGNGCTSGHGVCGIGLLSTRSILATLTFMGCGIVTVFVIRHGLGVGQ